MSTVWFTSDTHFDHPKVAELRGFGPSTAMHDATIMQRWNDTVRPDDQVWHLGDVTMGVGRSDYALHLVRKLHGHIHLITGNHDPVWPGHRQAHRHQREWLGAFASIQAFARRKIAGQQVLLSHFPYRGDHTTTDRHTQFRLRDEGLWLLHGHVHDAWQVDGRQINVGVDQWGLAPVSIDTIAHIIETRTAE